jgi:hypothetical protein
LLIRERKAATASTPLIGSEGNEPLRGRGGRRDAGKAHHGGFALLADFRLHECGSRVLCGQPLSAGCRWWNRLDCYSGSAQWTDCPRLRSSACLLEDCSCPLGLHPFHSARLSRSAGLDPSASAGHCRRIAHRRHRTEPHLLRPRRGRSNLLHFHPSHCRSKATCYRRPGLSRCRSRFRGPSQNRHLVRRRRVLCQQRRGCRRRPW